MNNESSSKLALECPVYDGLPRPSSFISDGLERPVVQEGRKAVTWPTIPQPK
jgi:hypothetical protein